MDQNSQNYEEVEIDLSKYIEVIVKRKNTFIAVFLLFLVVGLAITQFSPKIYRISMIIQPPIIGQSLTKPNDFEAAENLKSLITNGVYNDELKKILNMDLDENNLDFKVVIPSKTDILQVSVDRDSKTKEFGVTLLKNLCDVISVSYVKYINASIADAVNQVKLKGSAIMGAKEKAKNLQEQIKEVTAREDKLREEMKIVNNNTAQILAKREKLLKNNAATEIESIWFLTNFIQNNLSYLNQLNNQFSDLSNRRINLSLELKNTDSQISELQMALYKLNISKDFISNLKIIAQPKISPIPVRLNKKKFLAISVVMGLFFGMLAIFLQEFWVNNLAKK